MSSDNQHYVPRFLLKGFTDPKEQLEVFDKHESRSFRTGPGNVAAEKGFYDLETADGGFMSIDPGLQRLEDRSALIIDGIRAEESLAGLPDEDRELLAIFAAVQHLRTAQMRAELADTDRQLQDWLRQLGVNPHDMANYQPMENEDHVKAFSMQMVIDSTEMLAPVLLAKDWVLWRAPQDDPFIIGDHPIALYNEQDSGPFGNIGFAVEGIELYLPLSSRLSLLMMCPSYGKRWRKAWQRAVIQQGITQSVDLRPYIDRLAPMCRAVTRGTPYDVRPQYVARHNALQVSHAERWVYSPVGDFALVEEMLGLDSSYRHGRRRIIGWPKNAGSWTSPDMPDIPGLDQLLP